jgi:outer membrane lipopolysaccharide assembly protein LptE/RlpB
VDEPVSGRKARRGLAGTCCRLGLVLMALLAGGCGYHLAGGGDPPGGIRSMRVQRLQNVAGEIGLETTLTNDIIFEINRNGRIQVVTGEAADAVLSGSINSVRVSTISRRRVDDVLERRVTVKVQMVLKDPGGRQLWGGQLTDDEDYREGATKTGTNANKRAALTELSRRLAEKLYIQMTQDF